MSDTLVVPSTATLLAYGITEWSGAIEHLAAMAKAGVYVPVQTMQTLVSERRILLWRWEGHHGRTRSIGTALTNAIVAEARAHLTEHLAEVGLIELRLKGFPEMTR